MSKILNLLIDGAPEEIRTPDPQIRSLVLYPAELRVHTFQFFICLRQWVPNRFIKEMQVKLGLRNKKNLFFMRY